MLFGSGQEQPLSLFFRQVVAQGPRRFRVPTATIQTFSNSFGGQLVLLGEFA
jgi:hypothetical protein